MVLQDKYPLRKNGLEDKVFNQFKSMTQFIFLVEKQWRFETNPCWETKLPKEILLKQIKSMNVSP